MNTIKKIPEYKLNILGLFFEGKPWTSGEVHQRLITEMNGSHPSRASVINFMKVLAPTYLTYTEEYCKGGTRRVYTLKGTPEDFFKQLQLEHLEQFNENWLLPLEART